MSFLLGDVKEGFTLLRTSYTLRPKSFGHDCLLHSAPRKHNPSKEGLEKLCGRDPVIFLTVTFLMTRYGLQEVSLRDPAFDLSAYGFLCVSFRAREFRFARKSDGKTTAKTAVPVRIPGFTWFYSVAVKELKSSYQYISQILIRISKIEIML